MLKQGPPAASNDPETSRSPTRSNQGAGDAKEKRASLAGPTKADQNYKKRGLPRAPPQRLPPGRPLRDQDRNLAKIRQGAARTAEDRARRRRGCTTGHRRKKGVALPLRGESTPGRFRKRTWATSRAQGRGTPCALPPRLAKPPRPQSKEGRVDAHQAFLLMNLLRLIPRPSLPSIGHGGIDQTVVEPNGDRSRARRTGDLHTIFPTLGVGRHPTII